MGMQRDGPSAPATDATRVIAYFGDGATSQGDVNEAFVCASVFNAPVVFFCQNNQWAISEPVERQTRIPLYQRAAGFGFPGVRVDGNDVLAVLRRHARRRCERAREGSGPTLIEAFTYRMGAHTTSDDPTRYRRRRRARGVEAQGPDRARARRTSSRNGMADQDVLRRASRPRRTSSPRTCARAASTMPDPEPLDRSSTTSTPSRTRCVEEEREQFARLPRVVRGRAAGSDRDEPPMTLAKALNAGLRTAMEDDPKVLLMGEDIGKLGGVFRVTDGLQKDFGEDRVIDTPLAESGIIGTAIGLAMRGYRPVVRDPVRRLRLPGVRPDRQPARQDARPRARQDHDAGRHPDPVRRRHRRGRAPQREPRGVLRAHRRPAGRRLLQPASTPTG